MRYQVLTRFTFAAVFLLSLLRASAAGPVVTEIPAFGLAGTDITILGQNFTTSGLMVFFNGVQSAVVASSTPTAVTARVPSTAGTGPIRVEQTGVNGGNFTTTNSFVVVTNQPYIEWFDPVSGVTNTALVDLQGLNLTTSPKPAIRFGGVLATNVVNSASQNRITARVPVGALPGPITASNAFGIFTTSSNFTVFGSGPQISSFDPVTGAAGAKIIIRGLSFLTGNTTVRFGGTNAPIVNVVAEGASSQLEVFVPANAVTGPITVATPFGTNTTSTNFVFGLAPQISGFTPIFGPVGSDVVIDGVNFTNTGLRVSLNGSNIPPAKVQFLSTTQLRVTIHTGQTNGPFTVATIYGTNTTSTNFTVTGGAPIISDFSPAFGPTNTDVVIHGSSLINATNVIFGTTRATSFKASSDTQINVKVPAHALTGPVRVENPYGAFTTSSNFYLPVIFTGFSPAAAPIGVTFSVLGTNFTDATTLRVNGTPTPFTFVNDRRLDVLVMGSMVSGPVSVTTPGGTFATTNSFIVQPSADLGVLLAPDRNPIAYFEIAGLVATVTNLGPRTATNVVVTATLPVNFLAIGGTLNGATGTVVTNENTMNALVPLLASSNAFTFTLAGRAIGNLTNQASASVTSATPDGFPANNSATTTMVVNDPPRLGVRQIETNLAQFYWPSNWPGFRLQSAPFLPAGFAWSNLTNSVSLSGAEFRLQTEATNPAAFFRLIR